MNILIPMAGLGRRFSDAGYTVPKPFIPVEGKPMIRVVVESLAVTGQMIFVVENDHLDRHRAEHELRDISPGCMIVRASGAKKGAAWDALLARHFIDNDTPLLIANSDQYIEWNPEEALEKFRACDGGIVTFESHNPACSYARVQDGFVVETAEKVVISSDSTIGVYYWSRGSDFVRYADQMIRKDIRTNGEYYICPVFNEAIADGRKFVTHRIEQMWGLGTPRDLEYFLSRTDDTVPGFGDWIDRK